MRYKELMKDYHSKGMVSEKKIIEDAINFYFMDDDAPEGKVWIYMCAMDD